MGTGEWQKPNRNKKPKSGKGLGNKQPVGTVDDFRPAFKEEEFPPLGTVDTRPTRPTTKKTRLPATPQLPKRSALKIPLIQARGRSAAAVLVPGITRLVLGLRLHLLRTMLGIAVPRTTIIPLNQARGRVTAVVLVPGITRLVLGLRLHLLRTMLGIAVPTTRIATVRALNLRSVPDPKLCGSRRRIKHLKLCESRRRIKHLCDLVVLPRPTPLLLLI
jgi:hypothetical protein